MTKTPDETSNHIEPAPKPGQCTAHSKNTGNRCRRYAIQGGTVCPMHGGSAPQVKNKARQRLQALADPAIAALAELVEFADKDSTRLSAADSILDRTGYPRGAKVEVADAREILLQRLRDALGKD